MVTRPDPVTQKCPKGTVPCSPNTSVENTLCYPKKDVDLFCPITLIQILSIDYAEAFETAGFRIQKLDTLDPLIVVTSKNVTDTLPITKTKISAERPCLKSYSEERKPLEIYYPLEVATVSKCDN